MDSGTRIPQHSALFAFLDPEEGWLGARASYWLSLPLLCKLRHRPILRQYWNENVYSVPEEEWTECSRCHHFMGHLR